MEEMREEKNTEDGYPACREEEISGEREEAVSETESQEESEETPAEEVCQESDSVPEEERRLREKEEALLERERRCREKEQTFHKTEEGLQKKESEMQRRERQLEEEERQFREEKKLFSAEEKQFRKKMEYQDKKLAESRRKLKEDELFFEKKMEILKGGFIQLEADRKAVEIERLRLEAEQKTLNNRCIACEDTVRLFFTGVTNMLTLKKRYRDLIKIFHPDNLCGDTELLQQINDVYEILMDELAWQKKA